MAVAIVGLALRRRTLVMPVGARVVVLYWLTSYLVWLGGMHYYRYFAVGEYLAPAAMLALIGCVMRRGLLALWLPLVLAVAVTTETGSWGRMPWGRNWYNVRLASPPEPDAAVLVDGGLVSFVLPYFPEGNRFYWMARGAFRPLRALVAGRLREDHGPVYRLRLDWYPPSSVEPLGLADTGDCAPVRTRGTQLLLWRLAHSRRLP